MFEIILYNNRAEPNRLDKTTYLDRYISLRGTLKTSTSIINPSIIIQFENKREYVIDNDNSIVLEDGNRVVDITELAKFLQANYAYIPTFNRYYYITDIISVRNNLWEIQMSVDVLMSYKEDILSTSCMISRNEFEYNNFLVDSNVPSTVKFTPYIYMFDNFKTKINNRQHIWLFQNAGYIITCLSKLNAGYDTSYDYYYTPTITKLTTTYYFDNLNDFDKYLDGTLNPTWWSSVGDRFQNHSEYVSSTYLTPLDLASANVNLGFDNETTNPLGLVETTDIFIGNAVLSNQFARFIVGTNRLKMWSKIDNIPTYDSFTDANPYSRYYLYLPFYGVVEISSERIERGMCNYVVYDVDVVTGDFIATISKTEPIFLEPTLFQLDVWKGNMYVSLPNGYTNKAELNRNATQLAGNFATSLINDSVKLGLGLSKGMSMTTPKRKQISKKGQNVINKSVQQFGLSTFENTSSTLLSAITDLVPSGHCDGIPDSFLSQRLGTTPWLAKLQPEFYYPTEYNHMYGKPLMEYRKLRNISGYTVVGEVHLDNVSNATIDELNEMEDILLNGVILP